MCRGPFGSASTSRGTCRLIARPVRPRSDAAVRRRARSPGRAAAGSSSRRTPRARPSRCAPTPSVRMSRDRAAPRRQRRPARAPIGAPCRARSADPTAPAPSAAATCPAPRRPPATSPPCRGTGSRRPASAHARQPSSAASSSDQIAVREARADRLHLARILARRRRQRHAARHEHARQIARSPPAPSSSPAAPCRTSRRPARRCRVGSDRISRRKTIAASLRYGRLSNIAGGALRSAVAGIGAVGRERDHARPPQLLAPPPPSAARPPSARCDSPSAIGVPSGARMPPCVLQDEELAAAELRRLPAHAGVLRPAEEIADWAARAASRRVSGSAPLGPGPWVLTS